jgi:hypothetical protein
MRGGQDKHDRDELVHKYLRFAIVQRTMAEVGVGRPTPRARARALVLESTEIISQVRALIQTNL